VRDSEFVIGGTQPTWSVDPSTSNAGVGACVIPPALTAQELSDERLEGDHPAASFDDIAVLDADVAARPVNEYDCLLAIRPRCSAYTRC
jgi:hypothetical protein